MRILRVLAVLVVICLAQPAQAAEKFLDIREVKSPGGITAWLVEDHKLPIIALEFAFRGAGAALDPENKQGLARMASNTMDEGAGDLDSQTFQKTLTDNSITLHFSASRDDFSGALKTLTRKKDLAYKLLRTALTEPRFDEEPVDRMREANLMRLRASLSDPNWLAARLINDVAFAGHPYAMNSGGTLTTLKAITPKDLKKFASTRLGRSNLLVVAVGDISPAELAPLLDDIFGGLPEKADVPAVKDITVQNPGETVHYAKDIPQTIIEIIQPGIARTDSDYHPYQIMNFIFGGSGFGSRLTEEVREKRGLTYGIFSQIYLLDHLKGLSVSTSTENKNTAELLSLIRQEMEKMRAAPVSTEELKDAQAYLTGSMPLALTSTDAIAGLLLGMRLDDLPLDYLDTFRAKIEAVTADDVLRVAKRVMQPDKLTVALVGKPEKITPTRIVDTLPNVE